MPITGPTSYIETTEEFIDHWDEVDAALGAAPLVLKKNATATPADVVRADLEAMLGALVKMRSTVAGTLNDMELNRAEIDIKKAALLVRINQFNAAVRSDLANTKWPAALTASPSVSDGAEIWRTVLDDVESLWDKIDQQAALGTGVVLKLLDDYPLATFKTDGNELRGAFRAWRRAFKSAALDRAERNGQQELIYRVLKAYRQAVPVKLGAEAPLTQTLPRLTPEGGATPTPVTATGAWDAAAQKAKITYTAPAEANVQKVQLRGCPGAEYSVDDEVVLADHKPSDAREFLSDFSLALPGQMAGFRVVTVLDTGNEAGSAPVYVTRPAV